jgi:hypothetical protein
VRNIKQKYDDDDDGDGNVDDDHEHDLPSRNKKCASNLSSSFPSAFLFFF